MAPRPECLLVFCKFCREASAQQNTLAVPCEAPEGQTNCVRRTAQVGEEIWLTDPLAYKGPLCVGIYRGLFRPVKPFLIALLAVSFHVRWNRADLLLVPQDL